MSFSMVEISCFYVVLDLIGGFGSFLGLSTFCPLFHDAKKTLFDVFSQNSPFYVFFDGF
jgi:hypothetical protein